MQKLKTLQTAVLATMLMAGMASTAGADVKISTGPTPIPSGDANSAKDITLQNSRLAISFAVETPAPWGVARGGIIDAGVVRQGKIELDRVTLVDFIPNNWSSWPTTYQNVEIIKNTSDIGVVKTTRDWEETELETVYTLEKESNKIHIVTTIKNGGDKTYTDILSGYVLWTDGGHLLTTPGLEGTKKGSAENALADWVVNYDETWAVGIHAPYFDNINYYARDMYLKNTLKPGDSRVFEGWLQIDGDGDVSAMILSEIERKGLASGIVSGHVSTEDGKSIGSPVVIAEKEAHTYAWTIGKDGTYSFTLPVGEYTLYAAGKSYANSTKSTVKIKKDGTITQDFSDLKYPGKVSFTVTEKKNNSPIDARITIEEGETPVVGFLGKKTFFTELDEVGRIDVPIAPGKYTFKVASGESFVSKGQLIKTEVGSKEHKQMDVAIETLATPTATGWYSSDMHHHSDLLDGVTPPEYLVRSQLAGRLDFTLVSDHDLVKNNAEIQALSDKRGVMFIPSIEISPSWGHFNAFPVTPGKVLGVDPGTASVDEVFSAARKMGAMAISANHPYIPYGYFHSLDNGTVPGDFNAQFDLVELNAACKYEKTMKRIWTLWNEGTRYYLSAGTDVHDVWKDVSGRIRMYGHIDGKPTPEKFIQSLLDGHAYASFGPLIETEMMFGREVKREKGEPLEFKFTVKAVEGLKEVQLISQGKIIETVTFAKGETEKALTFKAVAESDTWFSLVVSDIKDHKAWTNPIWLDVVSYTKTAEDL